MLDSVRSSIRYTVFNERDRIMPEPKVTRSGSAPIVRQGQTENGQHGSSPSKQPQGRKPARDLNVSK